jgi:hypothetical protein
MAHSKKKMQQIDDALAFISTEDKRKEEARDLASKKHTILKNWGKCNAKKKQDDLSLDEKGEFEFDPEAMSFLPQKGLGSEKSFSMEMETDTPGKQASKKTKPSPASVVGDQPVGFPGSNMSLPLDASGRQVTTTFANPIYSYEIKSRTAGMGNDWTILRTKLDPKTVEHGQEIEVLRLRSEIQATEDPYSLLRALTATLETSMAAHKADRQRQGELLAVLIKAGIPPVAPEAPSTCLKHYADQPNFAGWIKGDK